uniref:Activin_recp domain-containing protein n=1 Tax=Parastrongyloides trichosuri TaxID=131310 RepID=A0A0N4Z005_PARTI
MYSYRLILLFYFFIISFGKENFNEYMTIGNINDNNDLLIPHLDIDIQRGTEGVNFYYIPTTRKRKIICQSYNTTECYKNRATGCSIKTMKCEQSHPIQNLFCASIFTFPAKNLYDRSQINKREPLFKGCYKPLNTRDCPKDGGCRVQEDPMIQGNYLIFCCCRTHNCNGNDEKLFNKFIPNHD